MRGHWDLGPNADPSIGSLHIRPPPVSREHLSGITCLPLPEQACIQLVTGPLLCRNCGKAFSSPLCKLGYRFLPWNPEMENFVGAPTGIEPASPAFRVGVLTTTPQHPGTKCIKFASTE